MKSILPAIACLVVALSACKAERTPAADEATPAQPVANPTVAVQDQPAGDVPPATAPSKDQRAADSSLARMDGYGDMRFGMTADEATQAWDGELKGSLPEETDGCYYLSPKWVKTQSDFAFMFEGGKFVRYDVGSAKEVAPGGGKVGMSVDELGKLYGDALQSAPHKYVQGGQYLSLAASGVAPGKLVFETDAAGKVSAWRVGLSPQADYVEGCS